jgi:hypothetical protein
MAATTIVTDDDATTVISEQPFPETGRLSRFSWSAALAGAFVALAVTFLLLTLGSGVGLSLVTTPALLHGASPAFLTLGAIYFLAAQAFGFAAGGHIVGRLIAPEIETPKEEEFRAGAHGLAVWAIAVVATATMAATAGLVAEGAVPSALAAFKTSSPANGGLTPETTAYWVDTLFRPAAQSQASLAWQKYAQAGSTVGTDAAPAPVQNDQSTAPPQQISPPPANDESSGTQQVAPGPSDQQIPPAASTAGNSGISAQTPSGDSSSMAPQSSTTDITTATGRNVGADKLEAAHILDIGMANAGRLTQDDRDRLAFLITEDSALPYETAQRRVDQVQTRIQNDELKATDIARKVASQASLWAALALLFGAIVSTLAAVSARWEDDRVSFLPFGRRAD